MNRVADPLFLFQRLSDYEGRLRGQEDAVRRVAVLREALARIAALPPEDPAAGERARAIARDALDLP